MPSLTLPYTPHRVLVGASAHEEVAAWIRTRRPHLDVRNRAHTEITADDLHWAEAYVGFRRPPAATTMGSVRWIHSTGAGVDAWLSAGLDPHILLTRSSESFGPMIAEWVVARVFAVQLQLLELATAQRAHQWAPRDVPRVAGTRALVVGTGDIGTSVATSLHALGCHVTGVSRSGIARDDHTSSVFRAIHPVRALPELVGDADWIVLTIPDTPASRGLISRSVLARCRGALLLNAGRGSVIEESALPEALDQGWLRGAALDVFAEEPLPTASPLWDDPRVLVSPHISGRTTVQGAASGFVACLDELETGSWPVWVVNHSKGY